MEDSMSTYDDREWVGLEDIMALSAAGDVAIPELEMADIVEEQPMAVKEEVHEEQPVAEFHLNLVGQRWTWSCTTTEMAQGVGVEPWCPTSPRSLERESSPRGEVVQAPRAPPAHLWAKRAPEWDPTLEFASDGKMGYDECAACDGDA
ncbi:hypothetical protein D1007_15240 [Hordeum vulgare]|nr:hypothetical protein D1007_15240 [Hordeum vulgare]